MKERISNERRGVFILEAPGHVARLQRLVVNTLDKDSTGTPQEVQWSECQELEDDRIYGDCPS
jgi:hypothetical protein